MLKRVEIEQPNQQGELWSERVMKPVSEEVDQVRGRSLALGCGGQGKMQFRMGLLQPTR